MHLSVMQQGFLSLEKFNLIFFFFLPVFCALERISHPSLFTNSYQQIYCIYICVIVLEHTYNCTEYPDYKTSKIIETKLP